MALDSGTISTGVDGFVRLVKDAGRIDINEAAAKLGVSRQVLEEWAQVLEEQGVIKIEYQLMKVYLIWVASTKEELEVKKEAVSDQYASTMRQAESQLEEIVALGKQLEGMQSEYARISDAFEVKLGGVKFKVEELKSLKRQTEELRFSIGELEKDYSARLKGVQDNILEAHKQLDDAVKRKEETDADAKKLAGKVGEFESSRDTVIKSLNGMKAQMEAWVDKASRQIESISKDFDSQEKEYEDLKNTLGELEGVFSKCKESIAVFDKDVGAKVSKLDRMKAESNAQLEKVSQGIESDSREAGELIKDFDARIEKMNALQAQLVILASERKALAESLEGLVKSLRDVESSKYKYSVDEVLRKIAGAKNKLDRMAEEASEYEAKQKEAKSSLKKIWELEGKGE